MSEDNPHRYRRPFSVSHRPISNMLLPIPIICFVGAVLTDWTYLGSDGNLTWLFFSAWLIPVGLVFGGLAALLLLIDGFRLRSGWLAFLLLAATWVIELLNAFVHMRDGWTAVAGLGFTLSIVGAVLALLSGWFASGNRSTYIREPA